MDSRSILQSQIATRLGMLAMCAASSFCVAALGQEVRQPVALSVAPPPMRFVCRDDRAELSSAKDAKARIRIGLELAESRLRHAEQMTVAKQYDGAAGELGSYEGIIEDSLRYLTEAQQSSGKTRDLYRRVELTLRSQAPRLELIRRSTPLEYAVHVRAIAEYARTARAEALNSFYGDTVFHGQAFREEPKPSSEQTALQPVRGQQAKQP